MKRYSTVIAGAAACALMASPLVNATDHALHETSQATTTKASKSEAVGVGAGAIIGAAVGGPVGAILGAAIGGHYGDTRHQSKAFEAEASLSRSKLGVSRSRLSEALTEQEKLDIELASAQSELDELAYKVDRLFVERALVDGLQFDVHFDTDGVALDEPDRNRLRRLSELLNAVPEAVVELHGFADVRGDDEYNEMLSLDRAHTVADTLNALGVNQRQIKTHALGESRSTDRGVDIDAYSHDRRVSIRLQLPVKNVESLQENARAKSSSDQAGSGQ